MKAADLPEVEARLGERRATALVKQRLADGEPLRLIIGAGDRWSEIELTQAYVAGIRAEVSAALETRLGEIDAALAALGVEP